MNTTNATRISKSRLEFTNRSTATIAIETSILLLIGAIAITGNLLVFISIYRNPSLRTITNYFVLSLAITDLLNPVLCLPLTLTWSIKSRYESVQEMCEFQSILIVSFTLISLGNIVLMAVNRFVCVCKPQKYKKIFNKKTSLSMISCVWITFIASASVVLKGGSNFAVFSPTKIMCIMAYRSSNTTAMILGNLNMTISLVLSTTIIVYCYFKVFKKIREHKKNIAPSSNSSSLGTSVQEIKATWILFAVLMGFLFTWVPVLLIMLLSNLISADNIPREVHMIVTYAGISSSAINPVIYGAMNMAFRQEYLKIFGCK